MVVTLFSSLQITTFLSDELGLNAVLDSAINSMIIKADNFELKSLLLFNHKDGGKVILIKMARLEFFGGIPPKFEH